MQNDHLPTSTLCDRLRNSLQANAHTATFACGGDVYFRQGKAAPDLNQTVPSSIPAKPMQPPHKIEPVQVRFGDSDKGLNLVFPLADDANRKLQQLIAACQPATFGVGGSDVLDESYRKPGKLDETAFATSFCPYSSGIIDIVSQMLLPQLSLGKHRRSIRAELYKLNVYSAPSGKFKSHVDTPRSKHHVGSLVVCLPVDHEGGQLMVRNAGQEVLFDWSRRASDPHSSPCVKWAAFYGDCEHEVFEVTAGNRITLTYNLYATRGVGSLAGATITLNPTQLPMYEVLSQALWTPSFFAEGRVLGIYLTHSYAHTHPSHNLLPESLKGADWALYESARALGLRCGVMAVMEREEMVPDSELSDDEEADDPENYVEGIVCYADASFPEIDLTDSQIEGTETLDWGHKMPDRKIHWLNDGTTLQSQGELQVAYLAYGNQASLGLAYSRAVMLVRIPPFELRGNEDVTRKHIYDDVPELEGKWSGALGDAPPALYSVFAPS